MIGQYCGRLRAMMRARPGPARPAYVRKENRRGRVWQLNWRPNQREVYCGDQRMFRASRSLIDVFHYRRRNERWRRRMRLRNSGVRIATFRSADSPQFQSINQSITHPELLYQVTSTMLNIAKYFTQNPKTLLINACLCSGVLLLSLLLMNAKLNSWLTMLQLAIVYACGSLVSHKRNLMHNFMLLFKIIFVAIFS